MCPDTFNVLVTTLGCSTLTLGLQRRANRLGQFTVLICHHFRSHLERTPLKRFLYTWTEKRIVREADFIIAISGSTVRKLEELGRSGHDVLLARPGLNVRLADEPRFSEDPRRLLLVGNIEARKGILEAVKALARGLPVISTTAGAIPDMIEDGVSGLLVDPGDPHAIGECIRRLFTEKILRRNLAEGALRTAALFPSWDDTTGLVLRAVEDRLRQVNAARLSSGS